MGACGNLWQILATFVDFCQLFAFFSGRNVSGLNVFRTKRLLATDGGTAIHPKNEQIGGDLLLGTEKLCRKSAEIETKIFCGKNENVMNLVKNSIFANTQYDTCV